MTVDSATDTYIALSVRASKSCLCFTATANLLSDTTYCYKATAH